ncbi:MAG: hypothetical protein HY297_05355 [Thaumarchaeota archaeon]|nr:hypothetical protein [Nitrososphaerota archaeon]
MVKADKTHASRPARVAGSVRRISRVLQVVRDAVVLAFSLVVIGSTYGRWGEEGGAVFLVVDALAGVLILLTVVDVLLVAKKVKRKGFYFFNSILQIPILALFVVFILYVGVALLLLDVAVLATLPEKKTPEELMKHPPIPITRNYRITVGAGVLVTLASFFLPWLSVEGASTSLFGVYYALVAHTGLPSFSLEPTRVIFALLTLFTSPVSLVAGALGILRRRLSLVSGILAVLAGVSMTSALGASTGFGAYGFVAGGIVILVGFFGFRRKN